MYVLLSAKFSEYESSLLPNYMYSIRMGVVCTCTCNVGKDG